MANAPKCKICGKPATVHLTQIVDGKAQKIDLCENCAQSKGVTNPGGFDQIAELFDKLPLPSGESMHGKLMSAMASAQAGAGLQCAECGMTPDNFKKTGRLGCPHCYASFASLIEPMLGDMHKDVVHRGKVPTKSLARRSIQERLADLEKNLQDAIKSENYEDAARYRDQIRQLKQDT